MDKDISQIQEQLLIENKIKQGAETMLQVMLTSQRGDTISKQSVEATLQQTTKKIAALTKQLQFLKVDENISDQNIQRNRASSFSSKKLRKNEIEFSIKNLVGNIQDLTTRIKNVFKINIVCRDTP